ncbi:unnamed protein product [Caenorhabditis bovis]|uniref:Uncharacterized protein n=2 Tax=Caenorhabditis bovis TaxID=2654633 RepID=A0A8S1EFV9_9PELO|nr:unnamed protein product [Caenorhabditis bovis]
MAFKPLWNHHEDITVDPVPVYPENPPSELQEGFEIGIDGRAYDVNAEKREKEKAEKIKKQLAEFRRMEEERKTREERRLSSKKGSKHEKDDHEERRLERERRHREIRRREEDGKQKKEAEDRRKREEEKKKEEEKQKRHAEDSRKRKTEDIKGEYLIAQRDLMFFKELDVSLGPLVIKTEKKVKEDRTSWKALCHITNIPSELISATSEGKKTENYCLVTKDDEMLKNFDKFVRNKSKEFWEAKEAIVETFIKSQKVDEPEDRKKPSSDSRRGEIGRSKELCRDRERSREIERTIDRDRNRDRDRIRERDRSKQREKERTRDRNRERRRSRSREKRTRRDSSGSSSNRRTGSSTRPSAYMLAVSNLQSTGYQPAYTAIPGAYSVSQSIINPSAAQPVYQYDPINSNHVPSVNLHLPAVAVPPAYGFGVPGQQMMPATLSAASVQTYAPAQNFTPVQNIQTYNSAQGSVKPPPLMSLVTAPVSTPSHLAQQPSQDAQQNPPQMTRNMRKKRNRKNRMSQPATASATQNQSAMKINDNFDGSTSIPVDPIPDLFDDVFL